MKKLIFLLLFALLISFPAQAETVILKSGRKLEGTILARTTQFIRIDIGVGVELTYYLDQVESIDGVRIKVSEDSAFVSLDPLKDINENADSLAVDMADESIKLINNLDTQRLPEKLDNDPEAPPVNPFETPQPTYPDEDDQMEEYQKFERFRALSEMFDFFMETVETSSFPYLILGISGFLFLVFWIVSCLPLAMIAKTLKIHNRWMAYFPLFQIFLFIRLAGVPFWWVIFLFIPIVNFFIPLILWFKIAEALDQPTWLAFLMYVPLVNFVVLWYFAFSKPQAKQPFMV